MNDFVADMEQGGFAPESTNSIKRLNDVIRRYEQMLNIPEDPHPTPVGSDMDISESESEEEEEEEEESEEEED